MPLSKEIVFVTRFFPKSSETFVVSNVVEAIKKGFSVQVITQEVFPVAQSSQQELLDTYRVMDVATAFTEPSDKKERIKKAMQYSCDPVLFFYFLKYIYVKKKISLSYIFILRFYKSYRKATAFHVHFATVSGPLSILKKIGFLKSKLMVTFHGYDAFYKNEREKSDLQERYALLFKVADSVTCNTPYLKAQVETLNAPPELLKTVPMGIDTTYYTPKIYPKELIETKPIQILSIGRLIEFKGHVYGVQAVKKLVDKGYNVQYTIIGDGILQKELQQLIDELGLQTKVHLYGSATQEEIKNTLEKTHLFLMTSIKDARGREETQGVVTAEAQAMGVPVVGFKSGGVPYTVTPKTGILVSQKDIEALAQAMIEVLDDPQRYKEMSLEAQKWIHKEFSLSKMITNFYDTII